MPKTKGGSAKKLQEEVIDTLGKFFTPPQIETLSKLSSVLVETLLKKHPADEETYLEKLKEDFEGQNLIEILAHNGSNQLIQNLYTKPKNSKETYLEKLKEDFKEGDLIEILAHNGSNQLIKTLFEVHPTIKANPKKNRKHIFKN